MKTIALIPVRGGSKSIPLKNIKLINGRPLVYWSIDAAVQCKWIDEVYVSTDNEVIRSTVLNYDKESFGKLKCIDRIADNATDTASTESVLLEFSNKITSETIVLIQATSPLISNKHLDDAIQRYKEKSLDSMISVVRQKRFIWEETDKGVVIPVNYSLNNRPRRQDFQGYLVENGSFYITKTKALFETEVRVSGQIGYYEMPEESYVEIDDPTDWLIVEKLLKESKNSNSEFVKRVSNIKLFATDCDGVLTDAGMYYSKEGDALKKFNTKDGMGFALLKEHGVILAIITGENSEIVSKRAEKLGIEDVFLGCKDKVNAMNELLEKYNLTYEDVGYIGDDINDKNLLKKVGVSFAVNDAVEEIKKTVDFITEKNGGMGAIREIADLILSYKV
ncbi:N-acylneuraminate cytidylyltransferase [Sporosarcina luteola]|nr:N-acylneuraminate cytidylyltransferase [Sporosarcina luteola]